MSDSPSLLHAWLDRPFSDEQIATLSAQLAREPALADEMAERASLDQSLKSLRPHMPQRLAPPRRPLGKILLAAAACLLAGGIWWGPGAPPAPPATTAPSSTASIIRAQLPRGAMPRPPHTQDERARAALGRLLGQQSIGRRTFTGATLREIADECLGRLQQRTGFAGTFDLSQAGSRADRPLSFAKPAGSLRGLLLHASALAGCDVVLGPDTVAFVPLSGSQTKMTTKSFSADPHTPQATREFWSTGLLPPSWGLPSTGIEVSVQAGDRVTATATEWHLAQLERVLKAQDTPTLAVDVTVLALPPAAALEAMGLPIDIPTEAPASESPPSEIQNTRRFPMFFIGAVLTADQWEKSRPTLVSSPRSTLADFGLSVLAERRTDLGEHAPDVLRGDQDTLRLRVALSDDGYVYDLVFDTQQIGADPMAEPMSATSLSVWPGMTVLLPYLDPAAPPETRRRALAIRVHGLE